VVDDVVEPVRELGAHIVEVAKLAAVEDERRASQNERPVRGLSLGWPRRTASGRNS
jgi:hypothetical protein